MLTDTPYFKISISFYNQETDYQIDSFSLEESLRYGEHMSPYLQGYFSIPHSCSLRYGLNTLRERLGIGIRTLDAASSSPKWLGFCDHVETWFKSKIRPILEKEEEIHRAFFETP